MSGGPVWWPGPNATPFFGAAQSTSDKNFTLFSALQVWECRSRLARNLVARRALFTFRATWGGLLSWLHLLLLSLLCYLGHWGWHTTLHR